MMIYKKYFLESLFVFCMFSIFLIGLASVQAQTITRNTVQTMNLDITGECVDGTAIFVVTNIGTSKEKGISFRLLSVEQQKTVSERMMSLREGQTATFKVKNANLIPGDVGIFVNSKLAAREDQVDVAVNCN